MSGGGEHLKDEGSSRQVVVAGACAGLVSRFCIAPLDVIKIRLQLQTYSPSPALTAWNLGGAIPTFKAIFRDEGIRGFWKGNVPAELLYITYGSTQFFTYRLVSQTLKSLSIPSPIESFVSGGTAGATATTLTYPLDLLRTRFAAQGSAKVYHSLLGSVRDIACTEGIRGFFQGLGAGIAQIVPYMGLFFSTYEMLRPTFARLSLPYGSGDATAGIIASIAAKTGVFPLDLVRKRLQVQGPTRERFAGGMVPIYGKGVWKTGNEILRNEGWRGLYRGLSVGLVKAAPASAVTMWTYERVLRALKESGFGA
ncbi:mitochondrial thiamine pyrophosphate transporter [Varicellaria rhodocarpa]|nr:mitochondrial thiamine pyrophosphate transporter [Varicellaria rhodocarpa]